jgi:hypothetical protein
MARCVQDNRAPVKQPCDEIFHQGKEYEKQNKFNVDENTCHQNWIRHMSDNGIQVTHRAST